MTDLLEIQSLIHAYRDFGECVVKGVAWQDHGTRVILSIDYPWRPNGNIRADDEDRLIVELEFLLVQELHIRTGIPDPAIRNPELFSWGLAEVSKINVRDDELSKAYDLPETRFHHATVRREGWDWIDIIFAELRIEERVLPGSKS